MLQDHHQVYYIPRTLLANCSRRNLLLILFILINLASFNVHTVEFISTYGAKGGGVVVRVVVVKVVWIVVGVVLIGTGVVEVLIVVAEVEVLIDTGVVLEVLIGTTVVVEVLIGLAVVVTTVVVGVVMVTSHSN